MQFIHRRAAHIEHANSVGYLFILIKNNRSLLSRFLDVGLKLAWLPDFRVNLRTKLKLYMA